MNDIITTVILVGGLGTRLKSEVSDRPKVMALINGKPFLSYLFDQLIVNGFEEVVLCTGYKAELIVAEYGMNYRKLRISYSREEIILGTAGAVRNASTIIKNDNVLIMNGDSYCDANLQDFIAWHMNHKEHASILLTEVTDTARYGRVKTDSNGRIISFEEKKAMPVPGLINAGLYLIPMKKILGIAEGVNVSFEKGIFPEWICEGLFGYETKSGFIDIGTPESYKIANEFFNRISVK